MESSEGILVHELTRLSTDTNNKRPSSPLLYEESKRPRLSDADDDDDMETSSRESRWSRYRDCTNLSTLTETSDSQQADSVLEGYNVHVSANQVPDLEEHIDKLAMKLEEWSLVNLKEWRRKKAAEECMDVDDDMSPASPQRPNAAKAARQRQKAAKRNLMRALRHSHDESYSNNEAMQER
jgi:hypothetical protein